MLRSLSVTRIAYAVAAAACKPTAHCNKSRYSLGLLEKLRLVISTVQRYSVRQVIIIIIIINIFNVA